MAYFYNLLNCSTNQPFIGYSATNTIQIGKSYKVGATCYQVQNVGNPSQGNPVIGNINLDGVLFYDTCAICQNPQGQPSGGGGGGGGGNNGPTQTFYYEIKACSELNNPTATVYKARRISQFADLAPFTAIKVGNVCFTVLTFVDTPANPQLHTFDITSGQAFPTCAECTAPPPPVWRVQYTLQRCDNPNLTIQAYRLPLSTETPNLSFLSTGEIYKINNICYIIITAIWAQGPPDLSQPNVGNLSTFITCQACNPQLQPIGSGGSGSPTALLTGWQCLSGTCRSFLYDPAAGDAPFTSELECLQSGCQGYNCTAAGCVPATQGQGTYETQTLCANNCQGVNSGGGPVGSSNERIYIFSLRNCANPSDIIQGWKPTIESPGSIYRFYQSSLTWKCYTAYAVVEAFGEEIPTDRGIDLRNKPKFVSCTNCLPDEMPITGSDTGGDNPVCCFIGDSQIAMADNSYKNIEDVIIGEEVKTSSGNIAKVVDKITPIIGTRGLLSINNQKAFATPDHIFKSVDGLWLTADIELSRKSFRAFDDILKSGGIIKQMSIGDYIITEDGPVLIESFEIINSGNFDDTVVYDLKLDSDSDHTYFVNSYSAHNCDGLPFCIEFPNHPSCDPCFQNPCSPGCPLDCTKCPDDPRCNIVNCDEVPEPVQGELVYTFVKTPFSGNPPQASSQKFRIHECWQLKYCVCRSQPDPINLPNVYYYTVCLCNPDINNPCPAAGTFIRYECRNSSDPNSPIKREKWAVYENGSCGTYDQLIESNSTFCGAVPDPTCTPSGTLIRTYCIGTDKYGEYADGKCGKYIERIEINSKSCGYIDKIDLPDDFKVITEPPVSAQVYYPVNKENTLKSVDITSFALWSGDTPYLLSPATESLADSSSLNYILHVYDRSPDTALTCSAELQYNIIYADYEGKGATDLGGLDNQTLTKAMYTQYAHVLLPYGQTKFNFNGEDEDYVYIIDIARKRFKQSLDPGNWEITLASCSFSYDENINSILTNMYTASYKDATITFVDSLTKRPENEAPIYLSSKSYDIFVGTIEDGIGTAYLSSSIASQSLSTGTATHIIESNSDAVTTNTVIVQGAKGFYWGPGDAEKNANYAGPTLYVTCSYRFLKQDEFIVNDTDKIVNYIGSFTGSFKAPTTEATFTPTLISGSAIGHWDSRIGKMAISTGVSTIDRTLTPANIKLTYKFVDYFGNIKWEPVGQFTGPSEWTTAFISASYNQSIITGSYTGSAVGMFYADSWAETTFIDSGWDEDNFTDPTYTGSGNFPDLDNGATSGFVLFPVNKNSYGRVYPSHGIIVLSGKKLDQLGFNTNRSIDKNGYNTYRFYHSLKLVLDRGLTDLSGDKLAFYARGVDIKRSARYFITLKNSKLNYSNNPTYVTGSEGDIRDEFIYQNKAYFSSVGLYNADKELLAIGKVSKPIMSSLTDEMLFTVKIAQ